MPGAFPCGEHAQPPRSLVLPASRCSPGEELSLDPRYGRPYSSSFRSQKWCGYQLLGSGTTYGSMGW